MVKQSKQQCFPAQIVIFRLGMGPLGKYKYFLNKKNYILNWFIRKMIGENSRLTISFSFKMYKMLENG